MTSALEASVRVATRTTLRARCSRPPAPRAPSSRTTADGAAVVSSDDRVHPSRIVTHSGTPLVSGLDVHRHLRSRVAPRQDDAVSGGTFRGLPGGGRALERGVTARAQLSHAPAPIATVGPAADVPLVLEALHHRAPRCPRTRSGHRARAARPVRGWTNDIAIGGVEVVDAVLADTCPHARIARAETTSTSTTDHHRFFPPRHGEQACGAGNRQKRGNVDKGHAGRPPSCHSSSRSACLPAARPSDAQLARSGARASRSHAAGSKTNRVASRGNRRQLSTRSGRKRQTPLSA